MAATDSGSTALTSFIGRAYEVSELTGLLAMTRLLTLTGTGGIGKTRLALALLPAVAADFPDGAYVVELGTVDDAALLADTIAGAIGEPASGADLPGVIGARRMLLLLDNCEHLVDACARLVVTLLSGCPELRVVATSRTALRTPGELAWRVPSLRLPEASAADLARAAASEAVELFVARARLVRPRFAVTEQNAARVAEICLRLDGIPLALELAAARLRVLSVEQLGERLDRLGAGGRAVPERQRTLQATLDWSCHLLDEPARTLLRRIAVFAGGFTLPAAEAVCAGDPVPPDGVLDLLEQLVDHSLVEVDPQEPQARYRLLEVVRQYAGALPSSTVDDSLRRHAQWCLALAEEAEPHLRSSAQPEWLAQLAVEHANLRTALAWTIHSGETAMALRLAGALHLFWELRGFLAEGRRWCEAALALDGADTEPAAAAVSYTAGILAHRQGDPQAPQHIQAYLRAAEAAGDAAGLARAANALGMIAESARDYPSAKRWYERCLRQVDALGHGFGVAIVRANLANVAFATGELAEARTLIRLSLAEHRRTGMRLGEAGCLANLAGVCLAQQDTRGARESLDGALRLMWELDSRRDWPEVLGLAAMLAAREGAAEHAARLFGAADAANEAIGARFSDATRRQHQPDREAARARLGEPRFTASVEVGRGLPVREAFDLALSVGTRDSRPAHGLTPREQDVAERVARGLTNRQIADELTISIRTVDTHVAHLLAKLGITTRAQIAVWVAEHR